MGAGVEMEGSREEECGWKETGIGSARMMRTGRKLGGRGKHGAVSDGMMEGRWDRADGRMGSGVTDGERWAPDGRARVGIGVASMWGKVARVQRMKGNG